MEFNESLKEEKIVQLDENCFLRIKSFAERRGMLRFILGRKPRSQAYSFCDLYENGMIYNCMTLNNSDRRKGYGRKLINEVISFVRHNFPSERTLYIGCLLDNAIGLKFWENIGWHRIEEINDKNTSEPWYKFYYNL